MIRYRILGSVELSDGERPIPAGGPRQVALLAFLVVNANRAVSVDGLLDALWASEGSTAGAVKRVQVAIARLRRTLEAGGATAAAPLRTVAGGYLLAVGAGESDAGVFGLRFDAGRRALEAGDAQHAATLLREALGLWRGPALADVGYADWAQPEIRRLEELRMAATEARVEAELHLGRHAKLTAELESLVAADPTRERLTGLLMTALYRAGRQAEALDAYQRTRAHLAAELGLEPGPALRTLQAEILEQSPTLELATGAPGGAPAPEPLAAPAASEPEPEAAPAPAPAPRLDSRRRVCVLAVRADIGDPEVLHGVLERCITIVERHGGSVEHFLGDALVGFFGLDRSHGDDALRAARAAVELRCERSQLRLGIESGELFTSTGARGGVAATGAAVRAAGQLAERAAAGEILLGPELREAIGADADVDAASGRLRALRAEQPALLRRPDTPFVGRAREVEALHAAFRASRDAGACRLVTVVGPPGIGKSRLAGEFLAGVRASATVLTGRCLAYGEGTTYRAIADIVRGLGGDPREQVQARLPGDEPAVRGILAAIGLSHEAAQVEETSWALRRLLAAIARERPLVVAIEDIHWAQPALLEVLDHLVALSSGSPILLVCLTRPELLETRADWAMAQPNRSVVALDALAGEQTRELAQRLGAGERAAGIAQRAEGNPLFVEQLVAVGADRAAGELPASMQAVLAARIDRLDEHERTVLQSAAVEGRTFHFGALAGCLPESVRPGLHGRLVGLARKGLIGADQPEFEGEEAFRFEHALIREAAYAGLAKTVRAELHAGIAGWLEERPTAADEIVGYHLEQACRLAGEVGFAAAAGTLAGRAVRRLHSAARAALTRGDPSAASALLERAVALLEPGDAARVALLPALGASLFEAGRMTAALEILDEAIARARDDPLRARAEVEREIVRLETQTSAGSDRAARVADGAMPVLEHAGDDFGQARVWGLRAQIAWAAGQVGRADAAWSEAECCARRAGDERELFQIVGWRATAAVLGPTPVAAAIGLCEEFRDLVAGSPVADAWIISPLASLRAMQGEFELADRLLREAERTLEQLGGLGAIPHHEAFVRLLAGHPELAEVPLRASLQTLSSMKSGGLLATTAAMLAQAVLAQDRPAEAAELCRTSAQRAAADDIVTQVIWRGVQAQAQAREGRCDEAEALAREAVALVAPTDLLSHHGDALVNLAEVLLACCAAAGGPRRPPVSPAALRAKGKRRRRRQGTFAPRARATRGKSMPFAMNFTSVRVDAGGTTMSAHGVSDPADDPEGLADVTEIHIVVHGKDDGQAALHERLVRPEPTWSATFDGPVPFTPGDVVYVVGMAMRPSAPPMVWFNRVRIMDITDRVVPPAGA